MTACHNLPLHTGFGPPKSTPPLLLVDGRRIALPRREQIASIHYATSIDRAPPRSPSTVRVADVYCRIPSVLMRILLPIVRPRSCLRLLLAVDDGVRVDRGRGRCRRDTS